MLIKVKKDWKDFAEKNHQGITRRELLVRGLATGAMSLILPEFIARQAMAATLSCPTPVRAAGALGQIFSNGGPTMGARFISENQAALMSTGMARNYGISGQANLMKLGPNMVIDKTSPFGATLLQGPPGYVGGAAAWQANVLSKISGGGHLGPFNQDDGAGENTGLIGGVGNLKQTTLGKDIKFNTSKASAAWANGLAASKVSGGNVSPAGLSKTFAMTPAANGLINAGAFTAASDAANAISEAFANIFNTSARKGGQQLMTNAGCGFYGNSALADPNYGTSLFTPANIPALTAKLTVGNLSTQEQAQLAGFYQSAVGMASGVIMQFDGRDYHGASPQNEITPDDVEEARAIVMFLAACDAAQSPGAMIYLSNGQAIANGTTATTANVNGTTLNLNAPTASGDAGGSYNAGLIIFYSPTGAVPNSKFTGTVDANSGNAKIGPTVGSVKEAVGGLYLSALTFLNNGTLPQKAVSAMQALGVASNPSNIMVV
jgi:hypothetical protein